MIAKKTIQAKVNFTKEEIGKDEKGNIIYKIVYVNNPFTRFKLVDDLDKINMTAILEDLS